MADVILEKRVSTRKTVVYHVIPFVSTSLCRLLRFSILNKIFDKSIYPVKVDLFNWNPFNEVENLHNGEVCNLLLLLQVPSSIKIPN